MKNERLNKILELLTTDGKAEVIALSQRFGVSQVTIRKDLSELEEQGLIERAHGFARLRSRDDVAGRLAYHFEAKKKIAARAAMLVADGDTVMIESGSCCALLAEQLVSEKSDLTIITNSAFIADYIHRKESSSQIVLLGGIYQRDAQVMTGPLVRQAAENFFVHYFFIGTDGYCDRTGFTNSDQMRTQAVRDMAQQCDELVVLTESEKFHQRGSIPLNIRDVPVTVITDDAVPEDARQSLLSRGCTVFTV